MDEISGIIRTAFLVLVAIVLGKGRGVERRARLCAGALSAGWWYYGEATPELVEKFFEKQAKDGLIIW